jgi:hypothetical protein
MRRVCRAAALVGLVLIPTRASGQQPRPTSEPDSANAAAVAAAAAMLTRAQVEGQAAAASVRTGGWFGGGLASGLLLGVIGAGITYAIASTGNVELPPDKRLLILSQSTSYQQAYEKGFADKVRSKRRASALTGGLLGAATGLVIYLIVASDSGY